MVSAALQPINKNHQGGAPVARNRNEACSFLKAVSSAVIPSRAEVQSQCSALNRCLLGQAEVSPPVGRRDPWSHCLRHYNSLIC